MNSLIHHTAIVGEGSKIGKEVYIGCYSVVGSHVTIGQNVKIGNHVVIHDGSVIGSNVRIDDHTVIGKMPMRVSASILAAASNLSPSNIGDNCVIGTSAILYRGCNIGNACLIADLSTIRENVTIGSNTIIGRGVAVENNCSIGSFCKLETNVYITAYSELGDEVFVAPGVVTSNDRFAARLKGKEYVFKGVTIKHGGRVGAQATILPEITIYEEGFAAAGSVVTKDISSNVIHCGNPAKYMKNVPEDQLLNK
ncbi:MAG: UDP-3-O-(3-hydroxymyristoyl)glucosamine N-acyltransferase [Clostridiales bacterium GWB2_37_7]|nr:MAG: UDP-3-O-(3-hydroxymyristoyl)glucosamine N-acyltransferase [Clostridiales bacterium GWB2_37_7]